MNNPIHTAAIKESSALGKLLNSKQTPKCTYAILEGNAGYDGYKNLRLIRVEKGTVCWSFRNPGVKMVMKTVNIPPLRYADALAAMNERLAALS